MDMSIGWCAMIGRHKGLAQYGETWMERQLRREGPQQLNLFNKWQRDQEMAEFLDHVRWEDEGGAIYDKA